MKKIFSFILIFYFTFLIGNAQHKNEITILYLLPFHLNEGNVNPLSLRTRAELHQIRQFEMMGFWLGAKMALQKYENTDKQINVIVRDVTADEKTLKKILDDSELMANVNVIIGPFYGFLFPIAAEYATKHNIIIVNPFSTRYDFVANYSSVYKLIPPFLSRPKTIEKIFLTNEQNYSIVLWGDSVPSPELTAYKYYFNENNIRFKETNRLTITLDANRKNLIIALFEKTERVIQGVHALINNEERIDFVLVAPEKWLNISELTEDFYQLPHLYFFTNYFVKEDDIAVKQFMSDYYFLYETPALLDDYSYQGYDITRYFIELFFADFNPEEVRYTPLSYEFHWNRLPSGGFENLKSRLMQVKDKELVEILY
ncbi:MAG: hypothetical protein LBI45_09475 [Bacteroidales bacterium]|jgi:hypothetical protein|nr:hypothetical protein [Bacteroidales bacterium]